MTDMEALKTELENDPLGRGYSGMTAAEVRDSLRAQNITVTKPTMATGRTIMDGLGVQTGGEVLAALESAAGSDPGVKWALEYIKRDGVDLGNSTTRTQLDALESNGVLQSGQADAIKALAETQISRAQQLGLGQIKGAHITRARELING